MSKHVQIHKDAFTSGQISSKLWMCSEVEKVASEQNITDPQTVWILGGWYALSAFLLLSRENLNIKRIRSFDIDESATQVADAFMENWVWQQWQFKAFTQDVEKIDYDKPEYDGRPDWVINTSCEHFKNTDWFERIPQGCKVALQSNDMDHDDHYSKTKNVEDFLSKFKFSEVYYTGEKNFKYPDSEFTRHMIIAKK